MTKTKAVANPHTMHTEERNLKFKVMFIHKSWGGSKRYYKEVLPYSTQPLVIANNRRSRGLLAIRES